MGTNDRDWLLPAIGLTLGSGAIALVLIPDRSGVWPAVGIVVPWMMVATLLACLCALAALAFAREAQPLARIGHACRHDRSWLTVVLAGLFLAGINMTTFMWTKPLLNDLVPFWADPILASADHRLFAGHDPWTFLVWLNTGPMALFYHRGWFALMILALILTLAAPPSPRRSAALVTYFALWSVVGPLVHLLLPAAGPIFYEQLGYGPRFAGLHGASETRQMSDYLWTLYSTRSFGAGGGISAMPSMHIASTTWIVIATWNFARRLFAPMAAAAALIWLLSIALGWHYATDGLVGAAAAFGCYRWLLARAAHRVAPEPSRATAPAY